MAAIITLVIIFALVTFVFFYNSDKSKRVSQRSTGERIANTLAAKAKRGINKVEDSLNNPEELKKQLLEQIEKGKEELKSNFSSYLATLLQNKDTLLSIIKKSESYAESSHTNASRYKADYIILTKEVERCKQSEELENLTIAQVKANKAIERCKKFLALEYSATTRVESAKKKIEEIDMLIEDAKVNFAEAELKLSNKEMEVTEILMNPNMSIALTNLNISDLMSEYTKKMNQQNIDIQVREIISNEEKETSEVDTNIITEMYEKLQ